MAQIVEKNVVDRRKGYMYYIDKKGNVVETKMSRGGKKGRKVCSQSSVKKKNTRK